MSANSSFRDFEQAGWSNSRVCRDYDRHFGAVTIQSAPTLLDAAHVGEGTRVLDVCCGAGYATGLAAERGADATGVDFSPAQVSLAAARYPDATFLQGDATSLDFDDGAFDSVVNGIGIPHFANPDAAFSESLRVLRQGGRFAFSVYAPPEQAIGFGLVYAAVEAHGTLDIGLPSGPNFFLFSDTTETKRRLTTAGFTHIDCIMVDQTWHLPSVDVFFAAILDGSVRAAATLRGQDEAALKRIKSTVASTLAKYRFEHGYKVPMPVVITSAVKP